MNNSRKTWIVFISVLAAAVVAFLGVAAFALVSFLSSGTAGGALMWTGISLSAVYLAAGMVFFLFGRSRKTS